MTSPRSSARSATPTLIWQIAAQWEHFVHLIASVHSGHTSAINVLARFGSAGVLNCGDSVNALNRSIYVGRVASYQAKRHD